MAFKATLDIGSGEATLENVHFALTQATNGQTGKPTSQVAPSAITCEIRVSKDNIKEFWLWGMGNNEMKDGTIKYYKIDEDASLFELKFEQGFCTSFSSHMSASSTSDMTISIAISAKKMELDGEGFDIEW